MEKKILEFIIEYTQIHGYSPSIREIGDGIGLKSTCSVHVYLKRMFDSGMLETDAEGCAPRAIRVPGYKFVKENKHGENR